MALIPTFRDRPLLSGRSSPALDTNALSGWADTDPAVRRVLPKDRIWRLPVVAPGEFLYGIRQSRKRPKLERWVDEVKSTCSLVEGGGFALGGRHRRGSASIGGFAPNGHPEGNDERGEGVRSKVGDEGGA